MELASGPDARGSSATPRAEPSDRLIQEMLADSEVDLTVVIKENPRLPKEERPTPTPGSTFFRVFD
jgi:hypothetical protein